MKKLRSCKTNSIGCPNPSDENFATLKIHALTIRSYLELIVQGVWVAILKGKIARKNSSKDLELALKGYVKGEGHGIH
jgi:hypothetical protein